MSQVPENKILLVFCDGTGADGTLSGEDTTDAPQDATNVLRLSRAVHSLSTDGRRQIVFYQSGVGTEAGFDGQTVPVASFLQMFGTAVASKIRDAYVFIAQNFQDGDEVYIFGFSRGAYTARKLSGLIDKIGLLERESLGSFFSIWRQLEDGETPTIPSGTRTSRIRCVGVWDTVGSVFNTVDALSIKDTSLPPTVDYALHALSIQENRKLFLPTLWTVPTGGLAKAASGNTQVLKQVWFPGAHADVGGGYSRSEVADISLFWMVGEIKELINLDLDFLRKTAQVNPDPWGTSIPHNTFAEALPPVQLIVGHETRLESGQITAEVVFHPSLQVAPTILPEPLFMVTLPVLKQAFGPSWQPTYSTLNDFEVYCKNNWGQQQPAAPRASPTFESPATLFTPKLLL